MRKDNDYALTQGCIITNIYLDEMCVEVLPLERVLIGRLINELHCRITLMLKAFPRAVELYAVGQGRGVECTVTSSRASIF